MECGQWEKPKGNGIKDGLCAVGCVYAVVFWQGCACDARITLAAFYPVSLENIMDTIFKSGFNRMSGNKLLAGKM